MHNSIGLKLLRYIFGSYLLITVVLTMFQLNSEYTDTKSEILKGIASLEQTFSASLSEAAWDYDIEQLKLTIQGIEYLDYISAVKIETAGGEVLAQTISAGFIANPSPETYSTLAPPYQRIQTFTAVDGEDYYKHSFQLRHNDAKGKNHYIGDCHLYANKAAIFARVSYGFILIIINALLKTLALWLIFYYFTRKLVAQPMSELKKITQKIHPQQPSTLRNNDSLEGFLHNSEDSKDEISSFARSFDRMRQSIVHKLDVIEEQNISLEKRVMERTQELTEMNKKLETMATHDDLTGLPNRKLFNERQKLLAANVLRGKSNYALVNIDLRKFKDVNDSLGHQAGDVLLQEFAKRVSQTIREGDTIARMGGDEFCLLLPFVNQSNFQPAMSKIIEALEPGFQYKDTTLKISANIGIAIFPTHSRDTEELMHLADVAMYHSKKMQLPYCMYQVALTNARLQG